MSFDRFHFLPQILVSKLIFHPSYYDYLQVWSQNTFSWLETTIKIYFWTWTREPYVTYKNLSIPIPLILLTGRLLTRSRINKLVKPSAGPENLSLVRWVGEWTLLMLIEIDRHCWWTLLAIVFFLMLLFVSKNVTLFHSPFAFCMKYCYIFNS